MTTHEAAVYEFGEFRVDVRERQLLRNGRPIPLTGKGFDTLRVMLERAGRLVTKDELIQQLWPDTVVEENNLNQNISAVRKALDEQASGPRYIETVPRAGYRFVAVMAQGPLQGWADLIWVLDPDAQEADGGPWHARGGASSQRPGVHICT